MTTLQLIQSTKGKFFSVCFVKRSTGLERYMNCRLGVRKHLKGGPKAYNDASHNLVTVFDLKKMEYRAIPLDAVTWLKINGKEHHVQTNQAPCQHDPQNAPQRQGQQATDGVPSAEADQGSSGTVQ